MKFLKFVAVLFLFVIFGACNFPHLHPESSLPETPSSIPTLLRPGLTLPAPPQTTRTPDPGGSLSGNSITYQTQSGDTINSIAGRFGLDPASIPVNNPPLQTGTTAFTQPLSPGTPIQLILNDPPDWGQSQALLPDYLFVYGPAQMDFNTYDYVNQGSGWLKRYVDDSSGNQVTGAKIVENLAMNYSISPRLVLAILEYQLHALSEPAFPTSYSLGNTETQRKSFAKQITWMANTLNNGYYRWLEGKPVNLSKNNNPPDPRQNSTTVALLYYFSAVDPLQGHTSPEELAAVYQQLFGPVNWQPDPSLLLVPAGLTQPAFILPFPPGDKKWAYTGGPHAGWGVGDPLAAVDFAPPADTAGCEPSPKWALAMAEGTIIRADDGLVMFDLDGDGHIQTGWVIQYMHLFPESVPGLQTHLKQGDPIGHPSCAGGHSTGRHVHVARLYNGQWISTGYIPLDMDGWIAVAGENEYKGQLIREDKTLTSSVYGEYFSQLSADPDP